MKHTETIIIGGGQAGLAMSRCLAARSIDHVVFERGRVAQRWRTERWDSLRLLSPNWQARLPGFQYRGNDPDGFMTMPEVISYFERYARSFSAPVEHETTVLSVEQYEGDYRVKTNRGTWQAPNVVLATGYCDVPFVPEMGKKLSSDIHQLVPSRYRNPDQLPDGGVLVVGASASGIQLAQEIHRSGRPVTLAVGRHTRLPRHYRGRDIMWWLDRMGALTEKAEDVYDYESSRHQPSLQLVGHPEHRSIDLGVLQEEGVRLIGRANAVQDHRMGFNDDLAQTTAAAHGKLAKILYRIDEFVARTGIGATPAKSFEDPIRPAAAPTELDLQAAGISTVLWATGYRRHYPWLKVPVLDAQGELLHHRGIMPAPGMYAIGLNFLRRRNSSHIDGVGADAEELAEHIAARFHNLSLAA